MWPQVIPGIICFYIVEAGRSGLVMGEGGSQSVEGKQGASPGCAYSPGSGDSK